MRRARQDLTLSPDDPELMDAFSRLSSRDFIPPAPAVLPLGEPAVVSRALSLRTADELRALADAIVALPEADSLSEAGGGVAGALAAWQTAWSMAELFLRVGDARFSRLVDRLASTPGREADLALLRLRWALSQSQTPFTELTALADELLPGPAAPTRRAEALSRLVTHALSRWPVAVPRPLGAEWLVPVDGGRHIANAVLARARRPALLTELGPAGRFLGLLAELVAVVPGPLSLAETADLRADHEAATGLYATHLDELDRERVLSARAALLSGGEPRPAPPLTPRPLLPQRDLATWIAALDAREAAELPAADRLARAALHERLGDRRRAALDFLAVALARHPGDAADAETMTALGEAVRLSGELARDQREALLAALREGPGAVGLDDEVQLGESPALLLRAELAQRLQWAAMTAVRLAAARAATTSQSTGDGGDRPDSNDRPAQPDPNDPHHPESRLAAASDLLAEGRVQPAGNILAALLRKAEANTPTRLFVIVAGALEDDEPPAELVSAAKKALEDDERAPMLLSALRASPTAAFALHEELLSLAKDPSRPDPLRLFALECWLHIWSATTTPPNPDLLTTLRETEPGLIAAAAVALGGFDDPLAAALSFLAVTTGPRAFGLTPIAWSDALLALMLGQLPTPRAA